MNPSTNTQYLDRLPTSIGFYPTLLRGLLKLPIPTQEDHVRNLCLIDLYFLLRYITSVGIRMQHPWLFARAREVQRKPDGHLDLWAREHYKSTIITFGQTLQDILNDPEITVGIFSHTRGISQGFLRQIKRELEQNVRLKALFPEILWSDPAKESPKWSEQDGLIVKRKGNPKESTIEAWGIVDSQPTSRHFALRVYDDVVTKESVSTPEQVKKTTEMWELSDNLGTEGGKVRYIGTRYHLRDTYSVMLDRKVVAPRIYPATNNGRLDGAPVLFSALTWADKKNTQRSTIAAQMLQNPLADEDAVFRIDWLKPYEVRPRLLNVYIMCDPSKGRSATSDNTAISVVGVASGGMKYLLDGYCHRMTLSQRWTALRDLYRKWSKMPGVMHVGVGYERYGQQSDDEYFSERMEIEKVWFTIDELNWVRDTGLHGQSKRDRVERLEPDFRNARFLLPICVLHEGKPSLWRLDVRDGAGNIVWLTEDIGLTKLQQRALDNDEPDLIARAIRCRDEDNHVYDLTDRFIQEYEQFPFGTHDDLIDATSRIYDLEPVRPVLNQKERGEPNQYFDS